MTRLEALAAFFRARPGVWVDGRELSTLAGTYAWRSRCSDLRRAPYSMAIANRQRRVKRPDDTSFVIISEYRYEPASASRSRSAPPPLVGRECSCDGTGWRAVVVDGVERLARCSCRTGSAMEAR